MSEPSARPVRKSHRLPVGSYASVRVVYFFTVCARHHGVPFRNDSLARVVIESLLWTRNRYGWRLYSYCLMPDHLHFVCELSTTDGTVNSGRRGMVPEGVLDHVARFKSFTTRQSWGHGIRGELWQRGSYDEILDHARPVEEFARYTLDNPVRKGLVAEWTDWPYSGIVDPW